MDKVVQFRGTVYEQGSGMVAQKVMRDKTISTTAKAIYAYLCSFAFGGVENERKAFPSVKLQCQELGIKSDKTYYLHRKQLEDAGYITIESVRTDNGKFERNIYYIEAVPQKKSEEKKAEEPDSKNYRTVKNTVQPTRKNYRTVKNAVQSNTRKDLNNKNKQYKKPYQATSRDGLKTKDEKPLPVAVQIAMDKPYNQPVSLSKERLEQQERINAKLKAMEEKRKMKAV
jgi:hypothetical protein